MREDFIMARDELRKISPYNGLHYDFQRCLVNVTITRPAATGYRADTDSYIVMVAHHISGAYQPGVC
jgi:hypothetical protein